MQMIHIVSFMRMLSCAGILMLFLMTGQALVQENNDDKLPVAFSGSIAGDTASTRFFLDFDRSLAAQTFYMDNPNRIVIDLDEAVFNLEDAANLQPRGLITAIQYGRISRGRSRIVLSLQAPSEIIKASFKKRLDEDTFRFLLDLDSTDNKTYENLVSQQRLSLGQSSRVALKGNRVVPTKKVEGRFTIVIDPGHGGIDGGAVGRGGTKEKDIVFQFAKTLANKLKGAGPFDVLMTRDDDVFVSLRERLDFSRRTKADLFISIHADSLRQRSVRGSTIYTLSKKASDRLSERLAESENRVDIVAGLAVETEVDTVTDILIDLTTRETKRFSKRFSSILVKELDSKIRLIKNPQRSAAFGVLKAPDVPSVLIELGYLSNRQDEQLLKSEDWQVKASQAMTDSIVEFFKPRMQSQ